MANIGTLAAVIRNLLASLDSEAVRGSVIMKEIEDLKSTLSAVQAVLLDAESKDYVTHEQQRWLEKLKDVVYDADDLIDEAITLASSKPAMSSEVSEKVRYFFSSRNQLSTAYKPSRTIQKIRRKLDAIASDLSKFDFKLESQPIEKRKEWSSSYVYAPDIVGRDCDLKAIVDILLSNDDRKNVSYLSIVGIGGLGKTTLAQLAFNDDRVKHTFDLRLWVCVPDQFDVDDLLLKILQYADLVKYDTVSSEEIRYRVGKLLQQKRFLLVLDDAWEERTSKWDELLEILETGRRGSKVVVTARSKKVAKCAGNGRIYELQGLSDEDSWHLLMMRAFSEGLPQDMLEIGKKIVRKCCGVPLAVRAVGSLLYGQTKSKWVSFLESRLANIAYGGNSIISMLKLSYNNLESPLKTCFSFCALFPKNFEIQRDFLFKLWMAQGYVVTFDDCENCFKVLLQRCFFQDVIVDEYGEVISCKIHDLMHDLARQVAGAEICSGSFSTYNMEKIRHLFQEGKGDTERFFCMVNIRTYLHHKLEGQFPIETLIANCSRLRALSLKGLRCKSLPESIGKLLLLRFLDLSNSALQVLPRSLSRLHNLQSLDLRDCSELRELPKHLSKLVKLFHLELSGCKRLAYMPSGMDKLTCLRSLTLFVVAEGDTVGRLRDLKALRNLRGFIEILIPKNSVEVRGQDSEKEFLKGVEHLRELCIHFQYDSSSSNGNSADHLALLEKLQPHSSLKGLTLWGYQGESISSWCGDDWRTCLPNLLKIELSNCRGLKWIPLVRNLPHLNTLVLSNLKDLEYIEYESSSSRYAAASGSVFKAADFYFFPSLTHLTIEDLPELKGWWKDDNRHFEGRDTGLPSFHSLTALSLIKCPKLSSFPSYPAIEKLCLIKCNPELQVKTCNDGGEPSSSSYQSLITQLNLKKVIIDKLEYFNQLSHLSGGLGHLTTLHSLSIVDSQLNFAEEEGDSMSWISLYQSLVSLKLENLADLVILPPVMQYSKSLQNLTISSCPKLKALPEWMSCLSSLKYLKISNCVNLKSLPAAMRDLTSLQLLQIKDCPYLNERCHRPNGKDWPKIQHIPSLVLLE